MMLVPINFGVLFVFSCGKKGASSLTHSLLSLVIIYIAHKLITHFHYCEVQNPVILS